MCSKKGGGGGGGGGRKGSGEFSMDSGRNVVVGDD